MKKLHIVLIIIILLGASIFYQILPLVSGCRPDGNWLVIYVGEPDKYAAEKVASIYGCDTLLGDPVAGKNLILIGGPAMPDWAHKMQLMQKPDIWSGAFFAFRDVETWLVVTPEETYITGIGYEDMGLITREYYTWDRRWVITVQGLSRFSTAVGVGLLVQNPNLMAEYKYVVFKFIGTTGVQPSESDFDWGRFEIVEYG